MRKLVSVFFSVKVASIIVFLGVCIGIFASISFQYFGNYTPCKLCIIQRYSFLSAAILLLTALRFYGNNKLTHKIFFNFSLIALLCAAYTSLYQLLIQFDIVSEPLFCKIDTSIANKSVEELERLIEQAGYSGGCKSFGPTILNLPISFYSCIASIAWVLYLRICYLFSKSQ